MAADRERLLEGIEHARAGRWDEAHVVAQSLEGDPQADWLHAILHKIEGDASNSRYWYSRSPHSYDSFADSAAELDALTREIAPRDRA